MHKESSFDDKRNTAVPPVLAPLLVIAFAVSMSVAIFMGSQGFLFQTSESTSFQQCLQKQASQSSIAIETVAFSGTTAKVYFKNVGPVDITPALLTAQGISSNSGFTGTATNSTNLTSGSLTKGIGGSNAITLSSLTSGDVLTIKLTSTAGTFAQATCTVP